MRQDQIDRLNDLAESVGEVFINEADPENWTGSGIPLAGMDKDQRGGRYWDKKNAIQTGALLARILDLSERDKRTGPNVVPVPESDDDASIVKFEKRAKDLLRVVSARAG